MFTTIWEHLCLQFSIFSLFCGRVLSPLTLPGTEVNEPQINPWTVVTILSFVLFQGNTKYIQDILYSTIKSVLCVLNNACIDCGACIMHTWISYASINIFTLILCCISNAITEASHQINCNVSVLLERHVKIWLTTVKSKMYCQHCNVSPEQPYRTVYCTFVKWPLKDMEFH